MSSGRSSIRAPERQLQPAPEDRLAALERIIRRFSNTDGLVKRGGLVAEVPSRPYRRRSRSEFARLGDMVERRGQSGVRRVEIIKIGRDEVVVAPFERSADAGIGDAVFRRGPLAVAPHD